MNVENLTHSQQQPQGPSTYKYKPTIRLMAESQCSVPPKCSLYITPWSWMKSHARKHLQQQLRCISKQMKTVNLTESCEKHTILKLLDVAGE